MASSVNDEHRARALQKYSSPLHVASLAPECRGRRLMTQGSHCGPPRTQVIANEMARCLWQAAWPCFIDEATGISESA